MLESLTSAQKTMLDKIISLSRKWALGGEQVCPTAILARGHVCQMVPMHFTSLKDKERADKDLRALAKELNATFYTCVQEVWYTTWKVGDEPPATPPSESPGRKEAIYIIVETPTEHAIIKMDITRRGDRVSLSDPEFDLNHTAYDGRFVNIIPLETHHGSKS